MSTIPSQAADAATHAKEPAGLWHELASFFRQFIIAAFHPYRPEQHYMRGPGPACQAKREPLAHRHLI